MSTGTGFLLKPYLVITGQGNIGAPRWVTSILHSCVACPTMQTDTGMARGCLQDDSNFCQVGSRDNHRLSVSLHGTSVACKIHHLYLLPPPRSLLPSGSHLSLATQICPQTTLEDFQHSLCIRNRTCPCKGHFYRVYDAITRQHLAQSHSSCVTGSPRQPWITSESPIHVP